MRDFRISDAAIRYERFDEHMRFSDRAPFRCGSGATCRPTAPTSICGSRRREMRLRLGRHSRWLSGAEANSVAVIDADLANNRFTFSRNTLRLNAIPVGLDGWVELDDDAVVMDLTAGCDKVRSKTVLSLIPAFYTGVQKPHGGRRSSQWRFWAKGEMRGSGASGLQN